MSKNYLSIFLKSQGKYKESERLSWEMLAQGLSLSYAINPSTTPTIIEEGMDCCNINVLRQLLREQFDLAACGEYFWLYELEIIGYTCDEIADLLFKQVNNAL